MGKKLDALLGRSFKTSKFKTLANLAISRIAILKNQYHDRCSHAKSDIIQLLNVGQQECALLRVEHVIKQQNMLDVFVVIENYCYLLIERIVLIQNNRECPDELKEAISSLIFASPRCGQFPELQQICEIFTSRFGKEFAVRVIELRNNCGVNPKIIQKLSTRQASLESRLQVLKQIASDNEMTLHLEDDNSVIIPDKQDVNQKKQQLDPKEAANLDEPEHGVDPQHLPEELRWDEIFSESLKARKKYRDVAAAAQAAFESATHAAAAARTAFELAQSESQDEDPRDHYGSNDQRGIVFDFYGSSQSELQIDGETASQKVKILEKGLGFQKTYHVESFSSESDGKEMAENSNRIHLEEFNQSKKIAGIGRTLAASSFGSDGNELNNRKIYSNQHDKNELPGKEMVFDESDDETMMDQYNTPTCKPHDSSSDKKFNLPINGFPKTRWNSATADENRSDNNKGDKLLNQSPKWKPFKSQANPMKYFVEGRPNLESPHQLKAESTYTDSIQTETGSQHQ